MNIEQHLKSRFCDPRKYPTSLRFDNDLNQADFLLWNLSGKIDGVQYYNPAYPKKHENPIYCKYFSRFTNGGAVWGLETFKRERGYVFLVEGVFEATMLHFIGLNAIAVLGNNPKSLKPWLAALNLVSIAICQGDKAGQKLADIAERAIHLEDGKDCGDYDPVTLWRLIKNHKNCLDIRLLGV